MKEGAWKEERRVTTTTRTMTTTKKDQEDVKPCLPPHSLQRTRSGILVVAAGGVGAAHAIGVCVFRVGSGRRRGSGVGVIGVIGRRSVAVVIGAREVSVEEGCERVVHERVEALVHVWWRGG